MGLKSGTLSGRLLVEFKLIVYADYSAIQPKPEDIEECQKFLFFVDSKYREPWKGSDSLAILQDLGRIIFVLINNNNIFYKIIFERISEVLNKCVNDCDEDQESLKQIILAINAWLKRRIVHITDPAYFNNVRVALKKITTDRKQDPRNFIWPGQGNKLLIDNEKRDEWNLQLDNDMDFIHYLQYTEKFAKLLDLISNTNYNTISGGANKSAQLLGLIIATKQVYLCKWRSYQPDKIELIFQDFCFFIFYLTTHNNVFAQAVKGIISDFLEETYNCFSHLNNNIATKEKEVLLWLAGSRLDVADVDLYKNKILDEKDDGGQIDENARPRKVSEGVAFYVNILSASRLNLICLVRNSFAQLLAMDRKQTDRYATQLLCLLEASSDIFADHFNDENSKLTAEIFDYCTRIFGCLEEIPAENGAVVAKQFVNVFNFAEIYPMSIMGDESPNNLTLSVFRNRLRSYTDSPNKNQAEATERHVITQSAVMKAKELYKGELAMAKPAASSGRDKYNLSIYDLNSDAMFSVWELYCSMASRSDDYLREINQFAFYCLESNNHLVAEVEKFLNRILPKLPFALLPIYNLYQEKKKFRCVEVNVEHLSAYKKYISDLQSVDVVERLFITDPSAVKYWQKRFMIGVVKGYVNLINALGQSTFGDDIDYFIQYCRYIQQNEPACLQELLPIISKLVSTKIRPLQLCDLLYYDLSDSRLICIRAAPDRDFDFYQQGSISLEKYCELLKEDPCPDNIFAPRPAPSDKIIDFYLLLFMPNVVFSETVMHYDQKCFDYLNQISKKVLWLMIESLKLEIFNDTNVNLYDISLDQDKLQHFYLRITQKSAENNRKLKLTDTFFDSHNPAHRMLLMLKSYNPDLYIEHLFHNACELCSPDLIYHTSQAIDESRKYIIENIVTMYNGSNVYVAQLWSKLLNNMQEPKSYLDIVAYYYDNAGNIEGKYADYIVKALSEWLISIKSPLYLYVEPAQRLKAYYYFGSVLAVAELMVIADEKRSYGVIYSEASEGESQARAFLLKAAFQNADQMIGQDADQEIAQEANRKVIKTYNCENMELLFALYYFINTKTVREINDILIAAKVSSRRSVDTEEILSEKDALIREKKLKANQVAQFLSRKVIAWLCLRVANHVDRVELKVSSHLELLNKIAERIIENCRQINLYQKFIGNKNAFSLAEFYSLLSSSNKILRDIPQLLRQLNFKKRLGDLFAMSLNDAIIISSIKNPPKKECDIKRFMQDKRVISDGIPKDLRRLFSYYLSVESTKLSSLVEYVNKLYKLNAGLMAVIKLSEPSIEIIEKNAWITASLKEMAAGNISENFYSDISDNPVSFTASLENLVAFSTGRDQRLIQECMLRMFVYRKNFENTIHHYNRFINSAFTAILGEEAMLLSPAECYHVLSVQKQSGALTNSEHVTNTVCQLSALLINTKNTVTRRNVAFYLSAIYRDIYGCGNSQMVLGVTDGSLKYCDNSGYLDAYNRVVDETTCAIFPLHFLRDNFFDSDTARRFKSEYIIQIFTGIFIKLTELFMVLNNPMRDYEYYFEALLAFYSVLKDEQGNLPEQLKASDQKLNVFGESQEAIADVITIFENINKDGISTEMRLKLQAFFNSRYGLFSDEPRLKRHPLQWQSGIYCIRKDNNILGIITNCFLAELISDLRISLSMNQLRIIGEIMNSNSLLNIPQIQCFLMIDENNYATFTSKLTDEMLAKINKDNRLIFYINENVSYILKDALNEWESFVRRAGELLEYAKNLEDRNVLQYRCLLKLRREIKDLMDLFLSKYLFVSKTELDFDVKRVQSILAAIIIEDIMMIMNAPERAAKDLDVLREKYGESLDLYCHGNYDAIVASQLDNAKLFCVTINNFRALQQMLIRLNNFYNSFTCFKSLLVISPTKVDADDKEYKGLVQKQSAAMRIKLSLDGKNGASCRFSPQRFSLTRDSSGYSLSLFTKKQEIRFYYCPDRYFVAPIEKGRVPSLTKDKKRLIQVLVFQGAVLGYELKIDIEPKDESVVEFAKLVKDYFSLVYSKTIEVLDSSSFLADPRSYLSKLSKSDVKLLDILIANCKDILLKPDVDSFDVRYEPT